MEDSAMDTNDSYLIDMSLDEIIKLNRNNQKTKKPFVNKQANRQRGGLNRRGQFGQLKQSFKANTNLRQNKNIGFKQNVRQNFAANKRNNLRQNTRQNFVANRRNNLRQNVRQNFGANTRSNFRQNFGANTRRNFRQNFGANTRGNFRQNFANRNKSLLQYKQVVQRAAFVSQQKGIKVQATAGTRFRGKNFVNNVKKINRSNQNASNAVADADLITISINNNFAAPQRNRRWGSQPLVSNVQQQQVMVPKPAGVKGLKPELNQTGFTLNDRFSGANAW